MGFKVYERTPGRQSGANPAVRVNGGTRQLFMNSALRRMLRGMPNALLLIDTERNAFAVIPVARDDKALHIAGADPKNVKATASIAVGDFFRQYRIPTGSYPVTAEQISGVAAFVATFTPEPEETP